MHPELEQEHHHWNHQYAATDPDGTCHDADRKAASHPEKRAILRLFRNRWRLRGEYPDGACKDHYAK
jgi:hypothetical protein